MCWYMDRIVTVSSLRAATKLLPTMACKSELTNTAWSEINFTEALWTILEKRMKRRNHHLMFLSNLALDFFIALKIAGLGRHYRWVDCRAPLICG